MNSGEYWIITLLSFTLPCVSNPFLLHPGLISVACFPQADWLQTLSNSQPITAEMLARSPRLLPCAPRNLPATLDVDTYWRVHRAIGACPSESKRFPASPSLQALTMPATACALVLQSELDINTQAIPKGTLLTQGSAALAVGRPGLMVSLGVQATARRACARSP